MRARIEIAPDLAGSPRFHGEVTRRKVIENSADAFPASSGRKGWDQNPGVIPATENHPDECR